MILIYIFCLLAWSGLREKPRHPSPQFILKCFNWTSADFLFPSAHFTKFNPYVTEQLKGTVSNPFGKFDSEC